MNKIKRLSIKKVILVYLIIYFIIAGMYCGINGSKVLGEWDDYTYPAVTLITKHKISVAESDIPLLKEYYPEWSDAIESSGINNLSGRFTRNGGVLTWYFPTYAIVCIPMIVLLRFLELPTTYAFVYTNFFSVIAVLITVYKYLKASDKTKLVLIILLSINPIMFYYCWPSGESLIYSFLTVGLMCWYNKWYKRAAIFISLAGTLNATIMSIGIIMIIEYMACLLRRKSREEQWLLFIKRNILSVIGYGSCYIIGLIPMIYFYYNTGYINLTASYDYFTSASETTLQRLFAYLFDLNFGILPYYPVILIIGFILFIIACIKKYWRYAEWFITFIVNVFLYSIMVHINCGMAGMARYNTWGVIILIFAVCLFFGELIKKIWIKNIIKVGIIVNMVILSLIIYNYGPAGAGKTSYVEWTPIAQYIMDKFPVIYNPLHSTFNSRIIHSGGGYVYETPIMYTAEDGYIRKILASNINKEKLKTSLVSITNDTWLKSQLDKLKDAETYISIPAKYKVVWCMEYEIGEELVFVRNDNYNVDDYVISGLSNSEDWGTWTLGNEFNMRFRTRSNADTLHGSIDCIVFNGKQSYKIYVNDEEIAEGVSMGGKIEFDFNNQGSGKVVDIKIELPDAVSPESLGKSSDIRALALGIHSIMFTEN